MLIVPKYVAGNSTQQTPLLRVRSVFDGTSQLVQDNQIDVQVSQRRTVDLRSFTQNISIPSLSKIPLKDPAASCCVSAPANLCITAFENHCLLKEVARVHPVRQATEVPVRAERGSEAGLFIDGIVHCPAYRISAEVSISSRDTLRHEAETP